MSGCTLFTAALAPPATPYAPDHHPGCTAKRQTPKNVDVHP